MPPGRILIVGAGLAGARCAETLRAEGFEGELVLVGEEPIPPYERPALSKEFLAGERSVEDLLLRPESFWLDRRIELALGERVADRLRRLGGPVAEGAAKTVRRKGRPRNSTEVRPRSAPAWQAASSRLTARSRSSRARALLPACPPRPAELWPKLGDG